MSNSPTFAACEARYELRFTNLFNSGRGFVFPCDAKGCVETCDLTDHGRSSYLYATRVVGRELAIPIVSLIHGQ